MHRSSGDFRRAAACSLRCRCPVAETTEVRRRFRPRRKSPRPLPAPACQGRVRCERRHRGRRRVEWDHLHLRPGDAALSRWRRYRGHLPVRRATGGRHVVDDAGRLRRGHVRERRLVSERQRGRSGCLTCLGDRRRQRADRVAVPVLRHHGEDVSRPRPDRRLADLRPYDQNPGALYGLAALNDATNTDLRPFLNRGKLIVWHGGNDAALSYKSTAEYVAGVSAAVGGQSVAEGFMRFSVAPGVDQCAGGPGADDVDLLKPLDAWVTRNTAPANLVANKIVANALSFSRPLCRFPQYPRYTGAANDAAAAKLASSYTCTSPGRSPGEPADSGSPAGPNPSFVTDLGRGRPRRCQQVPVGRRWHPLDRRTVMARPAAHVCPSRYHESRIGRACAAASMHTIPARCRFAAARRSATWDEVATHASVSRRHTPPGSSIRRSRFG